MGPATTNTAPRYGLLLWASIASVAVQGAVPPSPIQRVVVTALGGAMLLLAFRAVRLEPRWMRIAGVAVGIVIGVVVARALGGGIGEGATRTMNAALLLLGPPALAVGILRDIRRTGAVRIESVMGVLALYILVGLFFAFVFGAIDQFGDAPVFAGGVAATVSRCVYFSFVTLATVGYGDTVTQSDLGHTLSVFEALLGQIYLVTVVSVLVSNIRPRGRVEPPPEASP